MLDVDVQFPLTGRYTFLSVDEVTDNSSSLLEEVPLTGRYTLLSDEVTDNSRPCWKRSLPSLR